MFSGSTVKGVGLGGIAGEIPTPLSTEGEAIMVAPPARFEGSATLTRSTVNS
jgi:hypothetical protein